MPTTIESDIPTSLEFVNLQPRGNVHPSPEDWSDQVLYFFMPDRFSDGKEPSRPRFDRANPEQCKAKDRAAWMAAGNVFQGGTLKGAQSKLDYLKALGATAIWVGPIWKQRADLQTYHGYGIQNFLDVDPRFGSRQDLRDLVDAAHERGMHVLLDVIINHTGNNFFYDENGQPKTTLPYRTDGMHPFHSWRSREGKPTDKCEHPDDGVWPREFQNPDWYNRAGAIGNWDSPGRDLAADTEFRRGDFFDLKDLDLGNSDVLDAVVRCYHYWIALSDCDGFRIDTLKHVPPEVSAIFCHEMRTFARRIGKKNFILLGEVTGDPSIARHYVSPDAPNLDCVLDIAAAPRRLSDFVKGLIPPMEFFKQFGGGDALGDMRLVGHHHVSILDDHDMVFRQHKHRFNWNNTSADPLVQTAHAVGVQLTTPGIPCIYYGTEQAFCGAEFLHDDKIEPCGDDGKRPCADRYVRESMFGGTFGAFETAGCHFFDRNHPTYQRIAEIAKLRAGDDSVGKALRRGGLFVRDSKVAGDGFEPPGQGEIAAWSRIDGPHAVTVAINTHGNEQRGADVTVDAALHPQGSSVRIFYHSGDDRQPERTIPVVHHPDGRATIRVDLPPAGMIIVA